MLPHHADTDTALNVDPVQPRLLCNTLFPFYPDDTFKVL